MQKLMFLICLHGSKVRFLELNLSTAMGCSMIFSRKEAKSSFGKYMVC